MFTDFFSLKMNDNTSNSEPTDDTATYSAPLQEPSANTFDENPLQLASSLAYEWSKLSHFDIIRCSELQERFSTVNQSHYYLKSESNAPSTETAEKDAQTKRKYASVHFSWPERFQFTQVWRRLHGRRCANENERKSDSLAMRRSARMASHTDYNRDYAWKRIFRHRRAVALGAVHEVNDDNDDFSNHSEEDGNDSINDVSGLLLHPTSVRISTEEVVDVQFWTMPASSSALFPLTAVYSSHPQLPIATTIAKRYWNKAHDLTEKSLPDFDELARQLLRTAYHRWAAKQGVTSAIWDVSVAHEASHPTPIPQLGRIGGAASIIGRRPGGAVLKGFPQKEDVPLGVRSAQTSVRTSLTKHFPNLTVPLPDPNLYKENQNTVRMIPPVLLSLAKADVTNNYGLPSDSTIPLSSLLLSSAEDMPPPSITIPIEEIIEVATGWAQASQ